MNKVLEHNLLVGVVAVLVIGGLGWLPKQVFQSVANPARTPLFALSDA